MGLFGKSEKETTPAESAAPAADKRDVRDVLDDVMRLDDVLSAVLVDSTGRVHSGRIPPKIKNIGLLQLVHGTMTTFLSMLSKFYDYGADRIVVEMGSMVIMIYSINRSVGFVCIIQNLANMGLLEVEFENSKRELKEMFRRV